MALYLVRWYDLRVSLVEARDETALLQAIDEVDSPGLCTWEKYQGPVWVDFRFPGDFEIAETRRDRVRREDIRPILKPASLKGELTIHADDSDSSFEMMSRVMELGFPRLAKALDARPPRKGGRKERVGSKQLEAAITQHVLDHDRRVVSRTVTFDFDDEGDWLLRRAETKYFRFASRKIVAVSAEAVEDFCFGERHCRPIRKARSELRLWRWPIPNEGRYSPLSGTRNGSPRVQTE